MAMQACRSLSQLHVVQCATTNSIKSPDFRRISIRVIRFPRVAFNGAQLKSVEKLI